MSVTLPVGDGLHESPLPHDMYLERMWEGLYKLSAEEMIEEIVRIVGDVNVSVFLADHYAEDISEHWTETRFERDDG